jgi:hypothetical protein
VLCVIGAVLGAALVDASREASRAPPAGDEVVVRLDELDRAVNG